MCRRFLRADYKIYDRYDDGDPYEDERYIQNFRLVREAIRAKRPLWAWMENRKGKEMTLHFFPQRLEYSEKDDKFRIIATGCIPATAMVISLPYTDCAP